MDLLRLICLTSLFLTGCCQQKNWVYREVVSDYPQFDSSQLIRRPSNEFSGIEVQILNCACERVGFLSIYCGEIHSPIFIIEIDNGRYVYEGLLMEGSQKVQMPDEATELLITALLDGQMVQIYFDHFSVTLYPENFSRQYRKMSRAST